MDTPEVTPPAEDSFEAFVSTENAKEQAPPVEEKPVEVPTPVEETEPEPIAAKVDDTSERNPDGTFKPKEKTKNRRDDPNRAVQDAIAKQRATERERDAARAELAAERQARQVPREPVKPTVPQVDPNDPEPKYEDFAQEADPYLAHMRATAKWEARQEFKAEQTKARETWQRDQHQRAENERGQKWQEKLATARKNTPDFDSRLNPDVPLSAPMMDIIKDSDVGPELLLHLSEHPDVAQRLSTLHPVIAIREMGKLEARLDAASPTVPAPKPPASHAKPPVQTVGGSQVPAASSPSDDEPFESFYHRENKQARR